MKILSGSSHHNLAKQLAQILKVPYVKAHIESFYDQELRIQVSEPLYEEDVVIIQSTSKPANDHLMELLLLIDTAKRAGAKRIIAVIPYFGYSRQDRPSYNYGPISSSLIASLLETAGADHIIAIDLHSKQLEGFFRIGVQNLSPISLFASFINDNVQRVVVSPDIGGLPRARGFSEKFNYDIAIINKSRDYNSTCHMSEVIGDVTGKHCILIDDIVDTADTLCKASELLMKRGALSVEAFITHAVLSGKALARIEKTQIKKVVITNSIIHETLSSKFYVVSIVSVLAESLKRLYHAG